MKKIYLTNPMFNNKGFATLLKKQGVNAYATNTGVIFDSIAFENYVANTSIANIPIWIAQNISFMKSDIHTLQITKEVD